MDFHHTGCTMSPSPLLTPEVVLRNYFHAKDENRPCLLDRVFTSDASLHIDNSCSNITFPIVTQGRGAIADTLVTQFNKTYENIYSFYLARPPEAADAFCCAWLVGMTEKDTKNTRVGCGTYDWTFSSGAPRLASALVISIHAMVVLPPSTASLVFPWLQRAGYPWTSAAQACTFAPPLPELDPVVQYLRRQAIGA
jgi:hypothetical protein